MGYTVAGHEVASEEVEEEGEKFAAGADNDEEEEDSNWS